MWHTSDTYVRDQLLPNGLYVEVRGTGESAYTGSYVVTDDHIDYVDDTGFTADGDFIDGILHHGGMILHPPHKGIVVRSRTQTPRSATERYPTHRTKNVLSRDPFENKVATQDTGGVTPSRIDVVLGLVERPPTLS